MKKVSKILSFIIAGALTVYSVIFFIASVNTTLPFITDHGVYFNQSIACSVVVLVVEATAPLVITVLALIRRKYKMNFVAAGIYVMPLIVYVVFSIIRRLYSLLFLRLYYFVSGPFHLVHAIIFALAAAANITLTVIWLHRKKRAEPRLEDDDELHPTGTGMQMNVRLPGVPGIGLKLQKHIKTYHVVCSILLWLSFAAIVIVIWVLNAALWYLTIPALLIAVFTQLFFNVIRSFFVTVGQIELNTVNLHVER